MLRGYPPCLRRPRGPRAWRPKITDSPKRSPNAPDCFLQVLSSSLIVGCVMRGRVICLRRQL